MPKYTRFKKFPDRNKTLSVQNIPKQIHSQVVPRVHGTGPIAMDPPTIRLCKNDYICVG